MSSRSSLSDTIMMWFMLWIVIVCSWSVIFPCLCQVPVLTSRERFANQVRRLPDFAADFVKYYECGDLAGSPQKTAMYKLDTQVAWYQRFLGGSGPGGPLHPERKLNAAQYTPPLCVFMLPWAKLPINAALLLWQLFTVLVGGTLILRFMQDHTELSHTKMMLLLLWVCGLPSFETNMLLGQTAFLIAGLWCWFMSAWLKEQAVQSGVAIALIACIKPHHAVLALVICLASRRWRTLAAMMLCLALLGCISIAVLGWDTVINYPADLSRMEAALDAGQVHAPNQVLVCIRRPLEFLLPPHVAQRVSMISFALALVGSFFIWRQAMKIGKPSWGFALVTTQLMMLVFSFHAVFYDILYLAVGWAMTVREFWPDKILRLPAKLEVAWGLLFCLAPLVTHGIMFVYTWDRGMGIHLVWLVILLVVAGWRYWQVCRDHLGEASALG